MNILIYPKILDFNSYLCIQSEIHLNWIKQNLWELFLDNKKVMSYDQNFSHQLRLFLHPLRPADPHLRVLPASPGQGQSLEGRLLRRGEPSSRGTAWSQSASASASASSFFSSSSSSSSSPDTVLLRGRNFLAFVGAVTSARLATAKARTRLLLLDAVSAHLCANDLGQSRANRGATKCSRIILKPPPLGRTASPVHRFTSFGLPFPGCPEDQRVEGQDTSLT
jgi:hypothetical protein